jgi:hypothetical protein
MANFVLFVVLRVDFPILWSALACLISFIPSVGFIISLLPQVLVALIAIGRKRAVLVAVGSSVINSVVEYVLQPMFKKRGLDLSFSDIKLSLIIYCARHLGKLLVVVRVTIADHGVERCKRCACQSPSPRFGKGLFGRFPHPAQPPRGARPFMNERVYGNFEILNETKGELYA